MAAKKNTEQKIKKGVLWGTLIIGSAWAGKILVGKIVESIRQKREENQYYKPDNNTTNAQKQALATQIATRFSAAFNPSGISWMRNTDGTNEQAVYMCARDLALNKIPWSMVNTAYKGVMGRDLIYDLQSELNSDELIKFNAILTASDPNTAYQSAINGVFNGIGGTDLYDLIA